MKVSRIYLWVVVVFSLAACGRMAVTDICRVRDVKYSNKNVDVKSIEKAILNAGIKRGWKMKKVGEGKINGTLHIRTHVAEIIVTYNKEKFNIDYADSKNMHYDPKDKTIHKACNGWITNLQNDIQHLLQ